MSHSLLRIVGCIAAAGNIRIETIGVDDDLVDDLGMDPLELLGLSLIIEEIFAIDCPADLFGTARYRTAATLAEWAEVQADQAKWIELQRQRRRA